MRPPRPGDRRLRHIGPESIRSRLGEQRGKCACSAAEIKRPVAGFDFTKQKPPSELKVGRVELFRQALPDLFVVVLDALNLPLDVAPERGLEWPWDDHGTASRDLRLRVAFDSRAGKDACGVGRYARCLLDALRELGRGEIVETHKPRRCDVFHSPWIEGAMLRSPVPMVATLHDLVALKRRGEYLRSGVLFKLRFLAVQRAVRVIVPTAAVADDAIRALQIPIDRIAVIAEAPAPTFYPRPAAEVSAAREKFGLPEQYLLWVGSLQSPDPRKRIAALARAERTMPLVLVGPTAPWAHELPGVVLTDGVTDDQLAAIYTGAHALVLPSDEEGFGLPPIEALACGTPVAACDVRAVREVLEGRATLTAVDDLNELIEAAESLERPAPAPPPWSWRDAAAATWDVYGEAAVAPARWRGPKRTQSVPATAD